MAWRVYVTTALIISVFSGYASAGTIYVDANATLGGDGTTWGTAYKYLQDAFYKPPINGDEIWVAAGTYNPDQDEGSNVTSGDRNATFGLINGVSLYGGFTIGGGTWEERDPNQHETILSGDLNGDDGPDFANNSENSYNVAHVSWASGTTVLNGFTVTGGNANGSGSTGSGGGIYADGGGNIIVTNCIFSENYAGRGGGLRIDYSSDSKLIDCTFINNEALYYGGGFRLWDVSESFVKNCKIIGNIAKYGGGADLSYGSPTLIDCLFMNNEAVSRAGSGGTAGGLRLYSFGGFPETEKYSNSVIINSKFIRNKSLGGGGIFFRGECYSTLINCLFVGNSSDNDGGAVFENPVFRNVYADYRNCSIAKNIAGGVGGGIDASDYDASNSTLTNCIVWGNEDSSGTGESAQIQEGFTPGRVTVNYSCIQDDDPNDGYIPFGGVANNNIDDNPNFVREPNDGGDGWNIGDTNDDYGNLRLQYVSPCIDTADNASVPADSEDLDEDLNIAEPIPYDLDDHPRIVDGDCNSTDVVDMGAYEFSHVSLGDFAGGCDVDFADFAVLALAWLTEEGQLGYNPNCDIAVPYDDVIDEKDLQVFTDNWLLGR